jgi:hypothetical protein
VENALDVRGISTLHGEEQTMCRVGIVFIVNGSPQNIFIKHKIYGWCFFQVIFQIRFMLVDDSLELSAPLRCFNHVIELRFLALDSPLRLAQPVIVILGGTLWARGWCNCLKTGSKPPEI